MLSILQLMADLADSRPLFHSEADFQHALAWQIQQQHPDYRIRLEYRAPGFDGRRYVDIWINAAQGSYAVELKYKTCRLTRQIGEERFNLLDQSAQDIGRYDFCKDIARLETLDASACTVRGYAILLTNDRGYWTRSRREDTVDAAFRLHQGRELVGNLAWNDRASKGTMKGRENPIGLRRYQLEWHDYSSLEGEPHSTFRFVVVPVGSTD